MTFAENLQQLPNVDHIAELQLFDAQGQHCATIPNQPGKVGSVRIYAALAAQYGVIDVTAAQAGLQLFAEHTAAARQHPGSHPNIDRLLQVMASGDPLHVQIVAR